MSMHFHALETRSIAYCCVCASIFGENASGQ